ncbi:glutamate decarboxylase [Segniliparus rugosus]|uniref:Glutamate decarboxylase n=1 Tax=Segniliparus rugosus (strain ATCC BAA-974 / DSM 45345 / CCUG 50838 / CIP 108380 / JCM 13579 / CDC 945) TaxID=679197 RepID=E5XQA0_SEGRC|nr:glutamate decarboxylase [Segniliparus rugosus]EFV13462.1 glutamate decarboxylase [Segniliparus rugosus ATCC BAA-974]
MSSEPAYTSWLDLQFHSPARLGDTKIDADEVARHIHDELMLDGSSRLNLATFVSTWMEPQARGLMAEAFDKNMIDKDEYPATAAIEARCVAIVADLFHAPGLDPGDASSATGVSTIGSSEAVMLGGLALKWRWRLARQAAGKDTTRPNLVLGSNVQVVWEKFCRYFDVEPRYLPMAPDRYTITPEQVKAAVDENTIGVVAILGTTFTGEFEPVAEIAEALDALAASGGPDVKIHVDAASGGFVAPFLHPQLPWDFRVPRVVSINVSGHKYGLTYPGVGFVVWRDAEQLPEELVFRVSYLGGDMPTFTLNFSRPGNQVIGQYYNFLRLGREGYTRVMTSLQRTARQVADDLGELPGVRVIADGSAIPVVAFALEDGLGFDVYELSHALRASGWQVPAYPMPQGAEGLSVLRIVVREGFSGSLAQALITSITTAMEELGRGEAKPRRHFAH